MERLVESMDKLVERIDQFFERIKQMNVVKVFLIAWVINFIWTVFIAIIVYLTGAEISQNVASSSEFTNSFLLLPFAAVAEEIIFRWSPMIILTLALTYAFKQGKLSKDQYFYFEKRCILALVVISSIIFGWVHGSFFNILMQGASGAIMYIIYLRAFFIERDRGVRDRWQIVPLVEATLYHSMANAFLIFL
jgi:hypothetical protein